jgi:uncharacterized surface protein with fasciclin (FAS1) repeats
MMKAGLLGAIALLGVTACTDDHFDVTTSSATGANTVWQNIQATADLDSVAQILRRTKVMTSETDKGQKQSYADLLDAPQEFTVWLPKDGSFPAYSYLATLDRADSLSKTHVLADSLSALRLNYEVGNQFVRNHVARFNYASTVGAQQVRLLNGKVVSYNASAGTFNDLALTSESNIHSSNGTLHVIDGYSPFAYNIYDYMSYDSNLTKLFADVDYYNKYTFSSAASTEGSMNDNGQMEYVDSIYYRDNTLLSSAGLSNITLEDSVMIAIFPTDAIYDDAKAKIASLYEYADFYNYDFSRDSHDFQYKGGGQTGRGYKLDATQKDSLQSLNALTRLLGYSVYSAGYIVGAENVYDKEAIFNKAFHADSLRAVNWSYMYNSNAGTSKRNPIFNINDGYADASDAEAMDAVVKASNGYVIPTEDSYKFDPAYMVAPSYYDALSYNLADVQGCSETNGTYTLLSDDNYNDTIDLGGLLNNNYYTYFPVNGNNAMTIDFKLSNILSNFPYKISIVTLPNRVNINNVRVDAQGVPYDEAPIFDALLIDDKGTTLAQLKQVAINKDKVEKLTLWDSFTFSTCYDGLPSSISSFPRLRIRVTYPYQTKGKFKALSLGRLVIEPVRNAAAAE